MKQSKKSIIDSVSFKNKTVLITGAASGIGKATAVRFAEAGARLLLLDINVTGLKETANICQGKDCQHQFFQIDLSNKNEIDNFWKKLDPSVIPDVIVNNAGIYPMMDYLKIDEKYLQNILDTNMNSVFWMCQNFIKLRGKQGGVIVNISSIEAILPFKRDMVHYSVSKAGIIALTRSLARDYGYLGFRSNVLLPGAINTPGTKAIARSVILGFKLGLLKTGYDFKQRLANGKWGEPDDIAKAVLFLSSDLASYIQGAALPVDGGFLSS